MLCGNRTMKKQTGMWVDAQVWEKYRDLCSREKLRPSESIEEFLKFVLRNGSAVTVLSMLQGMAKAKLEGLEAYARVLLDWYTHEKYYVQSGGEEPVTVEPLLLEALRNVEDSKLRQKIEEAMIIAGRKSQEWRKKHEEELEAQRKRESKEEGSDEEDESDDGDEEEPAEHGSAAAAQKIDGIKKAVENKELDADEAMKILEQVKDIREGLKRGKKPKMLRKNSDLEKVLGSIE